MTALRSYIHDDVTEVVVSSGRNPDFLYFGVVTPENSCHFTLPRESAETLEEFLALVVEEAGGRIEDRE